MWVGGWLVEVQHLKLLLALKGKECKTKGCVRLNNVMCLFCSLVFVYLIKTCFYKETMKEIGFKYTRKTKRLVGPFVSTGAPRTPRLCGNLVITPQGPGSQHNIRSPCRCTDTLGCSLLVTQQYRRALPHSSPPCSWYFLVFFFVFFLTTFCSFFPGRSCIVVEG